MMFILQMSGKNFFKQYGNLKNYGNVPKVAVALVLVLAVATSLWFAAPVRALTIEISDPSPKTLGTNISFDVTVNIEDSELLPIQSINLDIFENSAYTSDTSPHKASCTNLPLTATTKTYTSVETGGGAVSITATVSNWGWGYGYGYAVWQGYGYTFFSPGGYGYGYGYGAGTASIIYAVTWTSPGGWPAGGYKAEVKVTANTTTFTETSSEFTLSGPPTSPVSAPPPPAPGITDISDVVTDEGAFTETVITESFDDLAQLTIDEGTIGLIEGEPLSEISLTEMEVPPASPEDSSIIGLVYDFGPDGATFEPPITLTFTYDPALILEGVLEENLVIAMWDEDAGEWVELSPCTIDPVTHTITAPVSHFTAFTVLAYTCPATFAASDLSISPTEVDIGEPVTIRVLVINTGDLTGTYKVTLKVDKVVVATEDVTLAGGTSQKVTFTTSKDVAGTYAINVDGQVGTFTVKAVPPPPPPPINWWLIGGIIAAAIIIGVVIWLVVRRRGA